MGIKSLLRITGLYVSILLLWVPEAKTAGHQGIRTESLVNKTKKISVTDMRKDLDLLWSAIRELHPAYGIYTSPEKLKYLYNRTLNSIVRPLTEDEFISHVYPFLCALKCGHTQIKHSVNYNPASAPRLPHLPFQVLVRSHRVWITTHQHGALDTGDEILSINSIPVRTIVDHGYDLYCGDGYNETFKELFLSEYDGFEDVCNKYYHWKPPYLMILRNRKGALRSIRLHPSGQNIAPTPGPSNSADEGISWTSTGNTDYLPLRFSDPASTAWFQVKTYQYSDTLIYQEAFRQIKEHQVKNLIIDLRHNTGGDIRIAAKLLSFLSDTAFHVIKEITSRIANPSANSFNKYFDPSGTESFKLSFKPGGKQGKYYHIDFQPAFGLLYQPIPIDPDSHFSGRLFVLIDGATFSSGAHTAAVIKAFCKSAVFIGRETAGAEEGCSGGTIQHLTLPHTGIVIEFPWMRVISVARHPLFGRGIIPDHKVVYTPEDVVNKTDPDLKKTLSLIAAHTSGN